MSLCDQLEAGLQRSQGNSEKDDGSGCGDADAVAKKDSNIITLYILIAKKIMTLNRKNNIKPDASENKSVKREFELKAINRILDAGMKF